MSRFLGLLAVLGLLWAAPAASQPSARVPGHLYAVIFEVSVDGEGKVRDVKATRVIDPASGRQDPVDVQPPPEYLAAVRSRISSRTYRPDMPKFYTYTLYDPAQPDRADINFRPAS